MNPYPDLFERGSQRVQDQAIRLVGDIPADQLVHQPDGVVNHPAWTISHLIHYHAAILSLVNGQRVADPGLAPDAAIYDAGSTPKPDLKLYLPKDRLIEKYTQGHRQIREALHQAPLENFTGPPGLPRWAEIFATTADTLVYLLLIHESQHQGQIMVWRRARGIPLPD